MDEECFLEEVWQLLPFFLLHMNRCCNDKSTKEAHFFISYSGLTASFGTVVIMHYNKIVCNASVTENQLISGDSVEKLLGK